MKSTIRTDTWLQRLHIDPFLLLSLLCLMAIGLITIYSSGGQDSGLVERQIMRLGIALTIMIVVAQLPLTLYHRSAVVIYLIGLGLLFGVLFFGVTGKGAQRWLNLGFINFQPSEIMKLALPIMVARYISDQGFPVKTNGIFMGFVLVAIPTVLIAKQPDLGTSILIASSGLVVLFLAGMSWRFMSAVCCLLALFLPVLWFYLMKEYQQQRVMTFLNPESDPLGTGYHIIQSKIAIGSGGLSGKGYLQGTQSQLEFLPERHTDFIFAVFSEEFGLIGVVGLLAVYGSILVRGFIISMRAQGNFEKLLAGSITMTFFVYVFVNIGMVSGVLPVVGVPLPLISYGGTSMVTLLAGFGILMAISTQKRLISR